MDSPPLDNKTPFAAQPQVLLDKDGEKLVVMVKATFEAPVNGRERLSIAPRDRRRGIRMADIPWDPLKPEKSSVAYASDSCIRKPATDVLVTAIAYAPGGAQPSFDAFVKVANVQKLLKIYGLRVWESSGNGISAARPIDQLPLRYEYAWGGVDDSDPAKLVEDARNPVGRGVARDARALTHTPAPQIEDPVYPIGSSRTRPPPAGVSPVGRHWDPRRRFAGTYDEAWLDARAPLPPLDQDDRFFQCASPGLVASPYLRGGEQVATMNLVPGGGALAFPLPSVGVEIEFRADGREPLIARPPIDTVVLDLLHAGPDVPFTLEMVWRAAVKMPRRAKFASVRVRAVGDALS